MSLELALQEAYASVRQDVVIFDTLELRHPDFVDDSGSPTAIRVVIGWEDIQARLEPEAPMDPGAWVRFIAGAFEFSLPGFEENQIPQLKISLDGVSREVVQHIEAAMRRPFPIEITYRPYLSTDLSKPQMSPPLHMTLASVRVDAFQVSGVATLTDVHNWPFPSQKYNAARFPGLVR